jgi:hypothetical protein
MRTKKITNAPLDAPDDLIGLNSATGLIDRSYAFIHRARRAGLLRAWKIGGKNVYVSRSEVLALLDPKLVEQKPPQTGRPRKN